MPKGRGKGKKGKKKGMKLDDLLDLAQEKVQEKLDNREKFTDVSYLNYRKFKYRLHNSNNFWHYFEMRSRSRFAAKRCI